MKPLKQFLILLLINCSVFSQNLIPTVQQNNGDTLFCFTIAQSKTLAIYLQKAMYNDSIITHLEVQNTRLQHITQKKDKSISYLKLKINNLHTINQNQEQIIQHLNTTLIHQQRKIKRGKFQKLLLSVGLGVLTTIIIIK